MVFDGTFVDSQEFSRHLEFSAALDGENTQPLEFSLMDELDGIEQELMCT